MFRSRNWGPYGIAEPDAHDPRVMALGTSDSRRRPCCPQMLGFWAWPAPPGPEGLTLARPARWWGSPPGLRRPTRARLKRPSPPGPAQLSSPSARPAGRPTVAVNPAGASERRGPRTARTGSHFLRGAGGAGRSLHHSGEAAPGGCPPSFCTMIGTKGGLGAEPRDHATHLGRLMTAHPGPSRGAPRPRPPGARSARVRAPRRLPQRPAGRGRSPAVSAELEGPARGAWAGVRHQIPGCPDRPSRDSPGLSFLTCKLGLGVGRGGRKRSAAFQHRGLRRGWGAGRNFRRTDPRGAPIAGQIPSPTL